MGTVVFVNDFEYKKAYCRAVKGYDKQEIEIPSYLQTNLVSGKCNFNLISSKFNYLIELVFDDLVYDTFEINNPVPEKIYDKEFVINSSVQKYQESDCVDSDGMDEYKVGVVRYKNNSYYDFCDTDYILKENGCVNNNVTNEESIYVKYSKCDKGCKDGACLK